MFEQRFFECKQLRLRNELIYASHEVNLFLRNVHHLSENLSQEARLSRTFPSDNADKLSPLNLNVNILKDEELGEANFFIVESLVRQLATRLVCGKIKSPAEGAFYFDRVTFVLRFIQLDGDSVLHV